MLRDALQRPLHWGTSHGISSASCTSLPVLLNPDFPPLAMPWAQGRRLLPCRAPAAAPAGVWEARKEAGPIEAGAGRLGAVRMEGKGRVMPSTTTAPC